VILASIGPNPIPGIFLHFTLIALVTYFLVRVSRARFSSIVVALGAVLISFGLGFVWRHLGWDMWATWDDLIIDPYKHFQILKPRGENIGCFIAFSIVPFFMALKVASMTTKSIKKKSQTTCPPGRRDERR